ncbi:N-acetylmuramoyl-L-alanine amidase [Candidatus Pelagibacter sp.]|uniref:N-acetylmuramoyl-L-alanine amidase n=1 Tax=Candidatus Pelagibacter sp. TaxID=2024849 RepID=UPI003F830747|tara:strand:- start:97 stop:834 length:738 start_codon:yes stop_codon:yes gene_type:complete
MNINTTLNYSPNFDIKKRRFEQIKFIIFHYTGMKNDKEAINRLTDVKSKVSSHFLIRDNGKIITLVPELYVSWHAGISSWQNFKSINKHSIGIEISNPGHDNKYKNFPKKQIKSILKLSKYLIKKYKIKNKFILGHSDIAPLRKKDPGEKFPWKHLSKNNVGLWHDLNEKKLFETRELKVYKYHKINFFKNLYKIGYSRVLNKDKNKNIKLLTKAFQRRFRPSLINGIIDQECLLISKNIAKKFK